MAEKMKPKKKARRYFDQKSEPSPGGAALLPAADQQQERKTKRKRRREEEGDTVNDTSQNQAVGGEGNVEVVRPLSPSKAPRKLKKGKMEAEPGAGGEDQLEAAGQQQQQQQKRKRRRRKGEEAGGTVNDTSEKQAVEGGVQVFRPNLSLSSLGRHRKFGARGGRKQKKKLPKVKEYEEIAKVALREEAYPGNAPIPKKALKKFKKKKIDGTASKSSLGRHRLNTLKKRQVFSEQQAARLELRHQEEAGYIEMERGKKTSDLTQDEIKKAVDLQTAAKRFDLRFDNMGTYHLDFTRAGSRHLLFAGSRGHVATIDWMGKSILTEMNVGEQVQDCKWFHNENFFAVAQKRWVYVYDNTGKEIHCLKNLDCVLRMEFLQNSMLLASGHQKGYLSFLDVSVGKMVAGHSSHKGRLDVMAQNPALDTVHLGHASGLVTVWSPTVKNPLLEMRCNLGPVVSLTVDTQGRYMATSGCDRRLRIWDLRMLREGAEGAGARPGQDFGCLQVYPRHKPATALAFSQRGLLAAGVWKYVEVFKDCCTRTAAEPYLVHQLSSSQHCPENGVSSLAFCPFEDVLGVGHRMGVSSLIVPGAGEPNYDAMEANPYSSKRQRQNAEVQRLLNKVPAELVGQDYVTKVVPEKSKFEKNPYYTKTVQKPRNKMAEGPLARFQRR